MMAITRARLALEGLSVGDAFGEQLLHAGPAARSLALGERIMPAVPAVGRRWMWTDDTAMAISIVEVLDAHGGIDLDRLADAFARRYAAEPARGYGGGAHQVLAEIASGTPFDVAASALFDGQGSCGNGGGMRSAPIGAYFADDLDAVVAHAARSAAPTHAHPDGVAGAIAIAVAAASVVAGERDPRGLLETVVARTPAGPTREGVRRAIALLQAEPITVAAALGNGSRVLAADTIPFAAWCAATHLDDFAGACWACASVGGDIDTTCAMVGGIIVGAVGLAGIPDAWRASREPLPGVPPE
ncbi:MAG TPA: ADP-ribosylglycohydrolase family protein [Kofleriaceae bacterium]|jgi:ADP-ribosylglycohydrolase|nr:ADP-ribosylglycohydrolase family protein [Kofleriaceae bacterium]